MNTTHRTPPMNRWQGLTGLGGLNRQLLKAAALWLCTMALLGLSTLLASALEPTSAQTSARAVHVVAAR